MRLDRFLSEKMGIRSRSLARELIQLGYVRIFDGERQLVTKSSLQIDESRMRVEIEPNPLTSVVSRGALKLRGAIDHVNWPIRGREFFDVGQSTGGFTQVLLEAGARRIVGIEVGEAQLDPQLRIRPEVACFENLNVKDIDEAWLQRGGFEEIHNAVVDVSFIGLSQVLPVLSDFCDEILALVKPQFELGREALGKGGVVKEVAQYERLEGRLRDLAQNLGFSVKDYFPSSIDGKDGNKEFFICLTRKR